MSSIRFILRNDKVDKHGKCPLDLLYSISCKRSCFRTDIRMFPEERMNTKNELKEMEHLKNSLTLSIKNIEKWYKINRLSFTSSDVIGKLKTEFKRFGKIESCTTEVQNQIPSIIDDLQELREIPTSMLSICGVYFLCLNSEVLYVGQSISITGRILQHRQDKRIEFNKVFYVLCDECKLNALESYYINKYRPPENRTLGIRSVNSFTAGSVNLIKHEECFSISLTL